MTDFKASPRNQYFATLLMLSLLLFGATLTGQTPDNTLPMYGTGKKNMELLELDKKFIQTESRNFGSRRKASHHYLDMGWHYLAKEDATTAIKRFNQAWLLDSTNKGTYWGFGAIMAKRGLYREALDFMMIFQKSNPASTRILIDMATVYLQKAHFERKVSNLIESYQSFETAESLLKQSLRLNNANSFANYQLGALYYDTKNYDSSKIYLQRAHTLDSTIVNKKLLINLGIK